MLEIIPFTPVYKDYFLKLNLEWIEKYFSVCDTDIEQLSNPEKIVKEGGQVYFARVDEKIVGTCALVWYNDSWLELIKMAVTDEFKGLGIGKKLLEHCINDARKMGADKLILETAEELKTAISLYEKAGFSRFVLPQKHFSYNREVFAMKLDL